MNDVYDPATDSMAALTLKQITVLEEYAKAPGDLVSACREVGYRNPHAMAHHLRNTPEFMKEISIIHDVVRRNLRMTSNHACAHLLKFIDKFEEDYDASEDNQLKGQLSSTLAKMSDSYLKAAGSYAPENDGVGGVTINIDLTAGDEVEVDDSGRKAKIKRSEPTQDS